LNSFFGLPKMKIQKYEKYLPTAFNDSLTMLEKINKIIERMNVVTDKTNELVDFINEFIETYDERMKPFIIETLYNMSDDGTLEEIINETIFSDMWNDVDNFKDYVNNELIKYKNDIPIILTCKSQSDWEEEGADFRWINDAIEYLSEFRNKYKLNGVRAEIILESNYQMQEQILVNGIDLGWITIKSKDEKVIAVRSFLTERIEATDNSTSYPLFGATNFGVLPIIDVLFEMSFSGDSSGRHGVFVADGGKAIIRPNKGVQNAGAVGLYAWNGGWVVAYGSNFDNANGAGVQCFRNSNINFRTGTAKNAGTNGIYLGSSSVVEAMYADFSGASNRGAWIYANGKLNIREGKLNDCGAEGIFAHYNAIVNCSSVEIKNAGKQGIRGTTGAMINCDWVIIENSIDEGIFIDYGSSLNGNYADIRRCGGNSAVRCENGGRVNVSHSNIKFNKQRAIYSNRGGYISVGNSDCSQNDHSGRDIDCARGSIVVAIDTLGRTGQLPLNTVSEIGSVFFEEN